MQNPILFLLSFVSLIMSAPQLTASFDSTITVDGSGAEWHSRGKQLENGAVIAAANDNTHLYLCITIADPRIARQIMQYGSTLWINGEGKRKKEAGFIYPAPMTFDPAIVLHESERAPSLENLSELVESRCGINLEESPRYFPFRYAAEVGVEAALSVEDNALVYELRIPHRSESPLLAPFAVPHDSHEIRLTVETGVPEVKQPRETPPPPSLSMGSGGKGGRGGGGGKGGRSGGGKGGRGGGSSQQSAPQQRPMDPYEFSVEIALAEQEI